MSEPRPRRDLSENAAPRPPRPSRPGEPGGALGQAPVAILRSRRSILRNVLLDFRRDAVAKVAVVAFGLTVIAAIGYGVSYYSFHFIESFPPIGAQLNSRLLGLLFLVLLTMVAISSAIVSYTSLFLAKETQFFFETPLGPSTIFFTKLLESIVFSGWATLVLCFPILTAFGLLREAPPLYYVEAGAILVLFILFCGFSGTMASLALLTIVRRWTLRKIAVLAIGLFSLIGWWFWTSFDFSAFNGEENLLALNRFTMELTALQSSYFPSSWATSAILAAAAGHHSEVLFNSGVLLANTLIFVPILSLYARTLYPRRWVLNNEPAPARRRRAEDAAVTENDDMATAATELPATPVRLDDAHDPLRELTRKDALSFTRDPAQISQFLLFVLLTVVYVLSLVQIPSHLFTREWKLVLYFSNIAAISLILSSFTSRFLFPLISLEGRAFWIIGLAPIHRVSIVRQKVQFGLYLIVGLGVVAGVCSSISLDFGLDWTISAVYTIALCGWVLTSLAIGFGAAYPNLAEDNPARIAVGFGGTLNFFTSAFAVIVLIVIQATPHFFTLSQSALGTRVVSFLASFLFAAVVSIVSVRMGERAMGRMEF